MAAPWLDGWGKFLHCWIGEREQPDASGRVQSRERKQTGCGYFSGVLEGRGPWRHDDKEKLKTMNIERALLAIPREWSPVWKHSAGERE